MVKEVIVEKKEGAITSWWDIKIVNETETQIDKGADVENGPADEIETLRFRKDHGSAEKAEEFMEKSLKGWYEKGYHDGYMSEEYAYAQMPDTEKPDRTEPDSKKPKLDTVSPFTRMEQIIKGQKSFWEITLDGKKTTVEEGTFWEGSATPDHSEMTHASADDAEKFRLRMIESKKKEGYQEIGSGADVSSSSG